MRRRSRRRLAGRRRCRLAGQLRRWRAAESTRLVWRDLAGLDSVEDTLAGSTRIAEQALGRALAAVEARCASATADLRDADGGAASLVVFGLGKLGGGELNFSSDIDLIYAFAEHGSSDGARPLAAEDTSRASGQRLAQLLGDVTADGFSHRVDLRLRPFRRLRAAGAELRGDGAVLPARGPRLGALRLDQGAPVAGDIAAARRCSRRCAPSCTGATSTTPRSTACAR
jgi:glutamate-ammonia-ligase adenylyltransferase